ncbi:MAG: hypothetical protein QOF51_2384 [Chloroflexota bacterium]|nr:hypothetical protein [Chloroflexota bacterium]
MRGYITDPSAELGLALRDDLPEPSPKPDECVIDVRAFAVNRGEMNLLQQRANGWTPGQDVAGVVARAAADGSGPAVGARVVGAADLGGWSQRVNVPTDRVGMIPEQVSFAEAAALPVAGLTALRGLQMGGPLIGKQVLITGASGGVGSFAVQLAKIAGAHVTGHVSGEHRVETARALGADRVVTVLDESTGPFDLVFDGVGGQLLVDAIHRLAEGGTATAYGMASGERSSIAFGDFRNAPGGKLQGFGVYRTDVSTFGRDLSYLADLIAAGRLHVHVGATRDWSQAVAVIEQFRGHQTTGKVVFTVGG